MILLPRDRRSSQQKHQRHGNCTRTGHPLRRPAGLPRPGRRRMPPVTIFHRHVHGHTQENEQDMELRILVQTPRRRFRENPEEDAGPGFSLHISPPFHYARRSARRVGAYSLQPARHSVSCAFAVFRSVPPSQRHFDVLATNGGERCGSGPALGSTEVLVQSTQQRLVNWVAEGLNATAAVIP